MKKKFRWLSFLIFGVMILVYGGFLGISLLLSWPIWVKIITGYLTLISVMGLIIFIFKARKRKIRVRVIESETFPPIEDTSWIPKPKDQEIRD